MTVRSSGFEDCGLPSRSYCGLSHFTGDSVIFTMWELDPNPLRNERPGRGTRRVGDLLRGLSDLRRWVALSSGDEAFLAC
jgi:hypothetical protein